MPVRDGEAADGADVAGQGQLERAARQVPDLDQAVVARRRKPLVRRVHGDGADPALVARQHAHELPRRMPHRLRDLSPVFLGHDLHNLRGVADSGARLVRADGPGRGRGVARRLPRRAAHVRQHPRDGVGLRLVVRDGERRRHERHRRERVLRGLLGYVADVLVLVVHLHPQQHLRGGRVLRTPELMVAYEEVVRALERPAHRDRHGLQLQRAQDVLSRRRRRRRRCRRRRRVWRHGGRLARHGGRP
mmetsp:Transcript_64032/g.164776  ORF Transcript_64032/g.164776 Transcript_64032/m.164776 type:complete len:247 (+) Transcript_64032:867-1607(+)